MPDSEGRLLNGDPVIFKMWAGDGYRDVPAIYEKPCSHPSYKGRHLISFEGIFLTVREDQIKFDPTAKKDPWKQR